MKLFLKSLHTLFFKTSARERKLLLKHYFTSRPVDGPEQAKEFEIDFIEIDLDKHFKRIKEFADTFRISTGLEVEYNNKKYKTHDLHRSVQTPSKKLLIIAGMHGNETSGLVAILDILEEIQNNAQKYKNLDIRIITPLNPVGVAYKSRFNEQGIDINRDFKKFDSPQAKFLLDLTKKYEPDFILNLHEGPHKGVFLYMKGNISRNTGGKFVDSLRKNEIELTKIGYLKEELDPPGAIYLNNSYYSILMKLTNLIGVGYYDDLLQKMSIPCITIETSWHSMKKDLRIKSHLVVFISVCEELIIS